MLRNPGLYKQRQKQKAAMSFITPEILALEKKAQEAAAEQKRLHREMHPRKKQPRHVRVAQMNPLKK